MSIKAFHAFLQMPEEGYEIRFDDPRVGYFTTQVDDMTSVETTTTATWFTAKTSQEESRIGDFRACKTHYSGSKTPLLLNGARSSKKSFGLERSF